MTTSVEFHPLRVAAVDSLTDDAVALTFDVPAHLSERFRFLPGQHVTVRAQIGGRDVRCFIASQDGGEWQVIMRGRGINASGRVAGSLTLDAYDRGPTGRYRIGERAWRPWPRSAGTYGLSR